MDIKLFYLYRIANMIPMYTVDIFLRYLSWCGVILDGRVHFLNFSIIAKRVYFFDIHLIIRHLFRLSTE